MRYDIGNVAAGLSDLLSYAERDMGEVVTVADAGEDNEVWLSVPDDSAVSEVSGQAWFELVSNDGRRFRVAVTEVTQ